ncbi:MAG: imidazole glycerol phosphate synthase subunit HisH [Alphaproteobacteria bacterium]|nr:imidazole glycerol phosphate synthase subunit HisH [Alphaproteobacteria bacterium]
MIGVVDYGLSNVGAILNMLKKLGVPALASDRAEALERSEKLILPGVGAFDAAMARLRELDLLAFLERRVRREGVPFLGICLGMQVLAEASAEGGMAGLGWIAGRNVRLRRDGGARVPHMGWSDVALTADEPLFRHLPANSSRFYFVHSYCLEPADPACIVARCGYGGGFVAAVRLDNIRGVQFHPEKSHRFGLALLGNFAARC